MKPIWGRPLTAKVAIMVALFSLLSLSTACLGAVDASAKDDAYHYMKNSIDDQLYQEWWRFYVEDNDTRLMLLYLLSDPDNISQDRKILVQAVAFQDGRTAILAQHQSRGFGGDRNSPMLDIDRSGFSLQSDTDLHVWGAAEDVTGGDGIAWDLTFQPLSLPWFAIPVQAHFGHIAGDWIKWLVYMPSAQVRGSLTIGNKTEEIMGVGYHDHAWGRFALSDLQMTTVWAADSLDEFSLSLAEIPGEQRQAFLGLEKGGQSIIFPQRQIKINHSGYGFDSDADLVYPRAYEVEADSGDCKLNFTVEVLQSKSSILAFQPPQLSLVLIHQVCLLQGRMLPRSGEIYDFQKVGYCAYALPRLHPIFGRIEIRNLTSANSTLILSATNERTGQTKQSPISDDGRFSLDADFADYQADPNAPWIGEGDRIDLELREEKREGSMAKEKEGNASNIAARATLIVNLSQEGQEISLTA